jgi:hypothetical protein
MLNAMVAYDHFKSVGQVPKEEEEVVKCLAVEYIHRTRQLCKFELNINGVKE